MPEERPMLVPPYRWRKAILFARPKRWPEYEISVVPDGIRISGEGRSDVIHFDEVRTLQIFRPNHRALAFRIVPRDPKRTFELTDFLAAGYTDVVPQTAAFEKLLVAIHRECMSRNREVSCVLGEKSLWRFNKVYRYFVPAAAAVLLLLGVGMLIKRGSSAALFAGIALAALAIAERKIPLKKPTSYDPELLVRSGLNTLSW